MKQKQRQKQKEKPRQQSATPELPFNRLALYAGVILALTFIAFFPSFNNEFLKTWDDQAYVTSNPLVKDLSFGGIKKIFKEDAGEYANYHPLTIISLAMNYHEGVTAFPYIATNLFLHLLNTLLVFVFIYRISGNKLIVAGLSALWFGIHPMHVESVTWISERKDVLYTFFFLLALLAYWEYLGKSLSMKFYGIALLFFVLSMLSKAMAASLPVALLLLDYWAGRKFSLRLLLEKVPYVAIAVILGLVAIKVQAAGGATQEAIQFPFMNKVLHAGYGFAMYIVKLFVPVRLAAFYPYPYPLVNSGWTVSEIPKELYYTLLLSFAIAGSAFYLYRKQHPLAKTVLFGLGFYLATVALVLQYIPVGRTIMSDRYAYIPYIGLFFIIGSVIHYYMKPGKQAGKLLLGAAAVYSLVFIYLTMKQVKVWKNDDTLWTATINNYPDDNRIVLAYFNRAAYQLEMKKYPEALQDFLTVAKHDPNNVNTLERIGRIYGQNMNDLPNAMLYFEKAIALNPKSSDALRGLATAHGMRGEYNKALEYFLRAVELVPNDPNLLLNVAASYQFLGDAARAAEFKAKAEALKK